MRGEILTDDILIYTGGEREYADEDDLMKEHVCQVKSVLKKQKQVGLYVKFGKCRFHTKEVDFLGFRVSSIGITMQRDQIQLSKIGLCLARIRVFQNSCGLDQPII